MCWTEPVLVQKIIVLPAFYFPTSSYVAEITHPFAMHAVRVIPVRVGRESTE